MVIKRDSKLLLLVFSTASIFCVESIYCKSDDQAASFDFRREFEGYVAKNKDFLTKYSGYYKSLIKEPSTRFDNMKTISKADFPNLFEMIHRLAYRLSIDMPRNIVVSFGEDDWASVISVKMTTGKHEKLLVIGKYLFCNCSDAEIQAAMAHELAHIALKHSEEYCAVDQGSVQTALLAGIVAYALACCGGKSIEWNFRFGLLVGVTGYYGQKFLNKTLFSRDREKEADLTAVKILGSGKALISLLSSNKRQNSWLEQLFSTHPSIQERIRYIQTAMVNKR